MADVQRGGVREENHFVAMPYFCLTLSVLEPLQQETRCRLGSSRVRPQPWNLTVKETEHVIAIAAHRLVFFLRVALVAALAGYMLPTVSYAMHGDVASSYAVQADEHASHSHDGMEMAGGHGDQTGDHHKGSSKQDCCSSFCLNLAVVNDAQELRPLRASLIRGHTNDQHAFAEPIGLNRPPAFSA